jgi:hypothetical protein
MDDVQPTTLAASQEQESVNETPSIIRPITPPDPYDSDAINDTTVPIGLSPATDPIASTAGHNTSNSMAPTTPDHISPAIKARDRVEKRYQRAQGMVPGPAPTARCGMYSSYRSHLHTSNHTRRNICANEWCKLHPKGTIGEFNWYFDNLPSEEAEASYSLDIPGNDTTDNAITSRSTSRERMLL